MQEQSDSQSHPDCLHWFVGQCWRHLSHWGFFTLLSSVYVFLLSFSLFFILRNRFHSCDTIIIIMNYLGVKRWQETNADLMMAHCKSPPMKHMWLSLDETLWVRRKNAILVATSSGFIVNPDVVFCQPHQLCPFSIMQTSFLYYLSQDLARSNNIS